MVHRSSSAVRTHVMQCVWRLELERCFGTSGRLYHIYRKCPLDLVLPLLMYVDWTSLSVPMPPFLHTHVHLGASSYCDVPKAVCSKPKGHTTQTHSRPYVLPPTPTQTLRPPCSRPEHRYSCYLPLPSHSCRICPIWQQARATRTRRAPGTHEPSAPAYGSLMEREAP